MGLSAIGIIIVVISGILLLLFLAWTLWDTISGKKYREYADIGMKMSFDKTFSEIQDGTITIGRLDFPYDKNGFLEKTKIKRKRVLKISTCFLFGFAMTLPFITRANYFETPMGTVGKVCLLGAIVGYIYYAAKYYDKSEVSILSKLYYENYKDILFFEKNIYCFPGYAGTRAKGRMTRDIMKTVKFGQRDVENVIYAIKDISSISVQKDSIIIYGDIIMTSFDKEVGSNSYLDYIEINKSLAYKNSNMYSKKMEKIEIPRMYYGFEKFLISKKYSGTEKLL